MGGRKRSETEARIPGIYESQEFFAVALALFRAIFHLLRERYRNSERAIGFITALFEPDGTDERMLFAFRAVPLRQVNVSPRSLLSTPGCRCNAGCTPGSSAVQGGVQIMGNAHHLLGKLAGVLLR